MEKGRFLKGLSLSLLVLLLAVGGFFSVGEAPSGKVEWGLNFSARHASLLGLDWKETYLAFLKDLEVQRLKIAVPWDQVEKEKNRYDFSRVDWEVRKAQKEESEVILAIGMKIPRWPECHLPDWTKSMSPPQREKAVRDLIAETVKRYRESEAVGAFQIENEPFLGFGKCPRRPKGFLKREVETARDLTDKPLIISDSGEWSFWSRPARLGDKVATTIYRKVWFKEAGRYVTYPLPPVFYWRKALLVKFLFGKEVIAGEVQAEPWGPVLLYDLSRKEQKKTMNPARFEKTIEYARKTGLGEFYLWGGEWWYWLKTKKGEGRIWERARRLFLEKTSVLE